MDSVSLINDKNKEILYDERDYPLHFLIALTKGNGDYKNIINKVNNTFKKLQELYPKFKTIRYII